MSRRRRRSSGSPSPASVPRSVSNKGNGTTEDSDAEPTPPQPPQPRPSKRLPLVAVVVLAIAVAAGVLPLKVWLRAGPDSGSAAGLPVDRTQEWTPNDAHGQLHVMAGKSSLDAPHSGYSVVESTEDLIQSIRDAVQAGLQKERPEASPPDFFFPKEIAGVDTQLGYTLPSGEPLTRAMTVETGSTLTHRFGEVPEIIIQPTCANGAMTWMHADGQTPVVEEPTDLAGSTPSAPDGRVLNLPASLSSTMSAGQVSQRTIEESEMSAAGMEILPPRAPVESTEDRLMAPTKVEPWVGMLICPATFPEVVTARAEAEMMASSPSYPAKDVQTTAVMAKDELLLETLPSCAVANWRNFIPGSICLERSGPSQMTPGHETTAPIVDQARDPIGAPLPSSADVPGVPPAKTERSEQSTCRLSPQEDELMAVLSGGGEGTVQDEAVLEAPLPSAPELPDHIHMEGEKPGESKSPPPTQEDDGPAAVKREDSGSTEDEGMLELSRISEPALLGTKPTEVAVAGEPARCPRVVLEVPFSFATIVAERVQSTCPLLVEGDEPAAAEMRQDKGVPSDEVVSNALPSSALSASESINAGAEARGALAQLLPAQDEPTETEAGEGCVSPVALEFCPATLLFAISSGQDTATVCSSSFPAEDGPTTTIRGYVEVTTDADALLYRAAATAGISTTKADVETVLTTPALAEGDPTDANAIANDDTLEALACPADVPRGLFFVGAKTQTNMCPLPLVDTPEATEALTDGVPLCRTAVPSWATGFSVTCSVEGAVGEESTPYLPLEGVTTTAQATRDAEAQGKADSLAATVPEIGFSQAIVEEVDQLHLETLVREFNLWIQSITFPVRNIEAGVVANGMRAGLIATEALADGETYLLVPESIILDASKAREDPELGPPLARIRTRLSPIGLWDDEMDSLRVLLIADTFARADDSFWAPYVRLLPTLSDMMSYHPLFYDDTAIASLEGSDVQGALRNRRYSEVEAFNSKFVDDISAVLELEEVLGKGWITLERYLWATAILDSRMIWWDGRKHLVPLLDLVNNAQGPPGTLVQETVQDAEGNAVATATRSFETGTQVFENYGHANHVLFQYHGFSLGRENRHDCVWVAPQRLPRGAGHNLMLERMKEAFPGGRPSFCISLDKHGPYDFVSYARIAAGLPAFLEPPPVGGEPCSNCEVDEPSCLRAAEEGSAERSVHERWETLCHDPQGLEAVVAFLETRLSKYPRSPLVGGSDGDGDGGSCDGSGGENVGATTEYDGDARGARTAEEESRKFLDSERHLLQEILDYLVAFTPGSPSSERDHEKDKMVTTEGVLAGNYSQEDTAGDVDQRSDYDDGNSQADPVS